MKDCTVEILYSPSFIVLFQFQIKALSSLARLRQLNVLDCTPSSPCMFSNKHLCSLYLVWQPDVALERYDSVIEQMRHTDLSAARTVAWDNEPAFSQERDWREHEKQ
jgi:hypothetical protein